MVSFYFILYLHLSVSLSIDQVATILDMGFLAQLEHIFESGPIRTQCACAALKNRLWGYYKTQSAFDWRFGPVPGTFHCLETIKTVRNRTKPLVNSRLSFEAVTKQTNMQNTFCNRFRTPEECINSIMIIAFSGNIYPDILYRVPVFLFTNIIIIPNPQNLGKSKIT